jgi:rubrerythrin
MAVLTAAEALKWALEIEKNGEAFYHAVAAKDVDPEVKALFEDLAAQERGHYQVFQKMLKEVKPDPDLSSVEYEGHLAVLLRPARDGGPSRAGGYLRYHPRGEGSLAPPGKNAAS